MPDTSSSPRAAVAAAMRAALAELSDEERSAYTAPATANSPASVAYWARRVDPLGELDEDERTRRAEELRRKYFRDMAIERERRRREQRGSRDVTA